MRRIGKPWYRAGKRSWFVTVEGIQRKLHVQDPKASEGELQAALAALLVRLGGHPPATTGPQPTSTTAAVAGFLADAKPRVSPPCYSNYVFHLTLFSERFGAEPLSSLRPEPIEAWSRRPSWSQSTRHNALKTVAMLLRWAGCPLRLRIPSKTSAGSEMVIEAAQYSKLLGYTSGDFRQLIRFLWLTGCRPSEATGTEVANVDINARCVLLSDHKTVQKTGKVRTIYLPSEAIEVCREQLAKYDRGPIFRGEIGGRAFTRGGLVCRFGHLSERSGVKVTAYCFRHSFACRALSQGIPDAHVAALMGHTTTAMIHKNYGHLSEQARLLKDAAEKIRSA